MSVSRLVIGIVFLALGGVFFRGLRRLRGDGPAPARGTRGRVPLLISALAWVYTLVGLLWIVLAFA